MKAVTSLLFSLNEMARIGTIDSLDVRVYPEPLGNPSIHLFHKDFHIVVELKTANILEKKVSKKSKYLFEKNKLLPKEFRQLVKELLNKDNHGISNLKFLVITWNTNNPKYSITENDISSLLK